MSTMKFGVLIWGGVAGLTPQPQHNAFRVVPGTLSRQPPGTEPGSFPDCGVG